MLADSGYRVRPCEHGNPIWTCRSETVANNVDALTVSPAAFMEDDHTIRVMTKESLIEQRTAAVIVGGELNGLGLVRSMGRQKVPTIAVDISRDRAALWSRYARGCLIRSFTGHHFVEDMVALGKRFDRRPILFLTDEDAVHTVSENRDELANWFQFRLPSDHNVKLLSNKAEFHGFALQNNFPVPHSVILRSQSDLGLLRHLGFPCVLKPDDKRQVLRGDKERAVRVNSLSEALEHASIMLRTPGGVIAQEWIDGPESNIYFTLFYRGAEGRVAGIFTGRKILCFPPDVGSTAICIAAPEAREALEAMTLAFAECTGFEGMGSMEYKWDDNHNKYIMVEPTVGRTDWQEEIATLCGVNIPLAAYNCELGLPGIKNTTSPTQVAWRATFMQAPPRHLIPARTRLIDGYFRWDDPLPAFQYYCMDRTINRIIRPWRMHREFSGGNGSGKSAGKI